MSVKKISFAGFLIALAISLSSLYVPTAFAKAFFVQHFINLVAAVTLNPFLAVMVAFATSLVRNILGTGTILAFPGSMIGAFLAAALYARYKSVFAAYLGEIIGTGLLGSQAAGILANLVLDKEGMGQILLVPFLLSTLVGATLAFVLIGALKKRHILNIFSNQPKGDTNE